MLSSQLGIVVPPANVVSEHAVGTTVAASVSVNFAAVTDFRRIIHGLQWSYSAAPTGGKITVLDGANTIFETDVTASGPGQTDAVLVGSVGSSTTITLASGAGSVLGKVNYQVSLLPQ